MFRAACGGWLATGCPPPKSTIQLNEGEGVKVESTCVQSSDSDTISPRGRWVVSSSCVAWADCGRQAARPDNQVFLLVRRVVVDRQNACVIRFLIST